MIEILKNIISRFPKDNVWVFNYGSSLRNRKRKKMIDIIFVTKDPIKWHEQNILLNPSHYNIFKRFTLLKYLQTCSAGVVYKTLIPIDGEIIKYGVISEEKLFEDLVDWKYIYLAGRLHKPIVNIQPIAHIKLSNAYEANLLNAVKCALLLLPEKFHVDELFNTITNISYQGDFRMYFAEDINKIKNIVEKQKDHFYDLYEPILKHEMSRFLHVSTKSITQDIKPQAMFTHLCSMPSHFAYLLHKEFFRKSRRIYDQEEAFYLMSRWPNLPIYLNKCLRKIVFRSSVEQAVMGIFSSGVTKAFLYSMRKLGKGLSSHLGS